METKKVDTPTIDKALSTAREAWNGVESSSTAAKVSALRPLVKVAPNAATRRKFTESLPKGDGNSSSVVGRYWQTAILANKHDMSDEQVAQGAVDMVAAMKVKGGPEALDKNRTAGTVLSTAARLAKKEREAKRASRKSSPRKRQQVAESETIAKAAGRLTARLVAISKGEEGSAKVESITGADMEALSALAVVIGQLAAVQSVVPVVRRPRRSAAS